ncbi:MAG: tetratricopeptide repeat protein [Desulfurobacteriaceae bacterium]
MGSKLFGIVLVFSLFFSTIDVFAKEKFCFVQLVSMRNFKGIKKIFNETSVNCPASVYLLKQKNIYFIRVGPFKSLEKCKVVKKNLQRRYSKYKLSPIIVVRSYKVPSKKWIIKEKKCQKREQKRYKPKRNIGSSNKKQNLQKDLVSLYIQKAKVCMGRKDCTNAVRYLKLAIAKGGKTPKNYTYLGYAYLHLGKYTNALDAFKKALEIDPNYAEAFAGIGFMYLKLKSPRAAAIAFKKAYDLNPKEISYGINLAISKLESGEVEKSLEVFKNLKDRYPFIPEIYYNEAIAYLKQRRLKEAVEDFRIFLDLTKGNKFYNPYRKEVLSILRRLEAVVGSIR